MKKLFIFAVGVVSLLLVAFVFESAFVFAQEADGVVEEEGQSVVEQSQEATDVYARAKVRRIDQEETRGEGIFQQFTAEILSGPDKGKLVEVSIGATFVVPVSFAVSEGDTVVLTQVRIDSELRYEFVEQYRLGAVGWVFVIFILLVVIFAGWKGARSVLGLGLSVGVIGGFIVPQLLLGKNPLFICLIGSLVILCVTIYLAHGFTLRTHIALLSACITLTIALVASQVIVAFTHLFGLGSEEAFFLQYDLASLDLRGLLLGGMVIGLLGVLDDSTTAQAAAIFELKRANASFTFRDLYARGSRIGREHITSLVNTLALAYVGASLPLVVLVTLNMRGHLWVVLNSELFVEEIVRTLVGSSALVLAVPITTLIAAKIFARGVHDEPETSYAHTHTH